MCQHIVTLAHSNDYRQIGRCEHGTIHLNWDWATIYLDDEIFGDLIEALDKAVLLHEPSRVQHKHCHVFFKKKGYFQVWIRNMSINLSSADFMIFAELARTAYSELPLVNNMHPVDNSLRDVNLAQERTARASTNNRFSLN